MLIDAMQSGGGPISPLQGWWEGDLVGSDTKGMFPDNFVVRCGSPFARIALLTCRDLSLQCVSVDRIADRVLFLSPPPRPAVVSCRVARPAMLAAMLAAMLTRHAFTKWRAQPGAGVADVG